ncbi:hypothetical protein RND81_03G044000 [Saponaria officinalis]|uniref:Uncharacterized protein n=1 Tax=Saponaria officinalis TaxID=3572 RepID=A0AAW1LYN0_SAPOF
MHVIKVIKFDSSLVNFYGQQAYLKCKYQCFDRKRNTAKISSCIEHCSVPVVQSQNLVQGEWAKFQDVEEWEFGSENL